jgi:hypothetical protein
MWHEIWRGTIRGLAIVAVIYSVALIYARLTAPELSHTFWR